MLLSDRPFSPLLRKGAKLNTARVVQTLAMSDCPVSRHLQKQQMPRSDKSKKAE